MNADVASRMARAFVTWLVREKRGGDSVLVVGGRDGRPGGDALLGAFADGARACGADVVDLGVVTTPGTGLMVRRFSAAGGVVVTASHNPVQWNGMKLLSGDGRALSGKQAYEVYAICDNGGFSAVARVQPKAAPRANPAEEHVSAVLKTVDAERIASRRFRVVLDSVNGAGGRVGRMLLERLGCAVVHINAEHGQPFAHTPEPVEANLRDLCDLVRREGADVGFAQDPDADRLAIVDESGRFIGEEYTLVLGAKRILQTTPGGVAVNLSTSRMIDDVVAGMGGACRVHRSAVGEANVVDVMQAQGCVAGGEGNGGLIDPRVGLIRDSVSAMAVVLDLLAASGERVSEAVATIPRYATVKDKITCDPERIADALAKLRRGFANQRIDDRDGVRIDWPDEKKWVHVRGSNTEPIMRLIAEARDAADAKGLLQRIRAMID